MRGLLLTLDRISSALVIGAMFIAGACVLGIVVVNTIDTVGRAFFNRPMHGAVEITEVLLAICIVLAIPYAQRFREHIEIDIFAKSFGPRLRRACSIGVLAITIGVFGMLVFQSYESALSSVSNFEASAGFVRVPVWIGKVAVTVGFSIALLEAIRQLLESIFDSTGADPREAVGA